MFELIESAHAASLHTGWAGRAGSFALHSALVATAIVATREAGPARPEPREIAPLVWELPPRPPAREPLPAAPLVPGAVQPNIVVPAPPAVVPGDIPPPAPFAPVPPPFVPGAVVRPGGEPVVFAATTIHESRYVQELPRLLRHPPLRYPDLLRHAGMEGTILMEAVLDTLGAVERGTLRVLQGGHPLFEAEAGALIAGSRYRPARVNGRPVRVRFQVPVTFSLRR